MKKTSRKVLLIVLYQIVLLNAEAQTRQQDQAAITILDHMSSIIGDLTACSFTVNSASDKPDSDLGIITNHDISNVYFSGPDRFLVNTNGAKGHKGYWYNGTQAFYYNYEENNYVALEAPNNSVETIDTIHKRYGIEFPAADFFYPTFTDDLMENFDNIKFAGLTMVAEKNCFHIVANNKEMILQLWVSNDAVFLPVKMEIIYSNQSNCPHYEATFSNWMLNPDLPESMFEFIPPPKAKLIAIVPKY